MGVSSPEVRDHSSIGLKHAYGERVYIQDDALSATLLARLSSADTPHPELMAVLRAAYQHLGMQAFGMSLSACEAEIPTRMLALQPDAGVWRGMLLDPSERVVVLDIMRGGIVPAQTLFELLTLVLPLDSLRLDHLDMARISDESGRVSGVDLRAAKVGGTLEGATLVIPDPMGATGGTLRRAVSWLCEHHGTPKQILALPLIATPEFLAVTRDLDQEVQVFAGRVDRGLSPAHVLRETPGACWDEERGLTETGYIVPGAGGLGEVINNSWC